MVTIPQHHTTGTKPNAINKYMNKNPFQRFNGLRVIRIRNKPPLRFCHKFEQMFEQVRSHIVDNQLMWSNSLVVIVLYPISHFPAPLVCSIVSIGWWFQNPDLFLDMSHQFVACVRHKVLASFTPHLRCSRRSMAGVATPVQRQVCIVGAGPAGFYAAQYLVKHLADVRVDIVEKLPVPFGLVR